MLFILTFGAIINSLRFYPRAWGKEPFVSPLCLGCCDTQQPPARPFSALVSAEHKEGFCCNGVHIDPQAVRACWNLLSYSTRFLTLLLLSKALIYRGSWVAACVEYESTFCLSFH